MSTDEIFLRIPINSEDLQFLGVESEKSGCLPPELAGEILRSAIALHKRVAKLKQDKKYQTKKR